MQTIVKSSPGFQKLNYSFVIISILVLSTTLCKAQFSQGNLIVLQIGNGVGTLTNTGNALIFNEYNTSGALISSVGIPSTGVNAMVLRGNATSEGYISRSDDGNYIVFGAYMQSLPNTSVINTSAASNINRGIGLINGVGAFNIGASSSSLFSGNDIRGAAATNSVNLWASGSNQGSNYFGTASTATTIQNSKTNLRASHVFNGQLYCSSHVTTAATSPTTIGVYAIGSGTPTAGLQSVTTVINCGTGAQPGQFYFDPTGTICYVADARTSTLGGIQKWVNMISINSWTLAYTLPTGTAAAGAFGVVADFSGLNPKVYATTTESSANRLIAIDDVGAASTATTLATASTSNTIFRGLAFAPGNSTCVPVSIVNTNNNAPVCSNQNLVFNVNTTGSTPIVYAWSGQGAFSSTSVANPTVINSSTGAYTLIASNACGTASVAINVSINPTPTIQVNAATICSGGIATITASGAATYTWNTNSTSASFTANPSSTTNYTVNGTSSNGCPANTVTTSIIVVSSPSLSVNSPSICIGKTATIIASGASTYTWSNNLLTGVIAVSPSTTTVYTVNANASGCPATISITATVVVNPLPTPSINLSQNTLCLPQRSITLTGLPSGGVFSGSFVTGSVFSSSVIGTYSVIYSYTNANACSNSVTGTLAVSACLSVNENNSTNYGLNVYPNPAGNTLFLKSQGFIRSEIVIYDITSKKVLEFVAESDLMQVDISKLTSGIYYIRLQGNNNKTIKFIKE